MAMADTAVVTGASSGIGEAIAAALLERGIPVVTLQRSAPKLKNDSLHFRPIDLTDLAATRKVANDVAAEFPVRYLVNNAGENAPNPLEKATVEELNYVTTITLGAAMVLIQSFVPGMRRAKFGRIVSMSAHFNRGHPHGSVKRQTVIDKVLVKRLGTPQDVAHLVIFLLDRDSGFITGQSIYVCGGTSVTGTGGE
jgi:3-oxoacyl-[acyl-carrier protein] reductase